MERTSNNLPSNRNLQNLFQHDLLKIMDEEERISASSAFLRICIDYLGFNPERGVVSDGKGDHGIDFIEISDSGVDIIQSKSVEFDQNIDFEQSIGPKAITDLPRIRALFENLGDLPSEINADVKQALEDIRYKLRSNKQLQKTDSFHVKVHLCAQATKLTEAAKEEFSKLDKTPILYEGMSINITYTPILLKDLLDAKWRQTNTKWKNKQGNTREKFKLDICGGGLIRDSSKSCIFFTKASQLVEAYEEIGYQIFESNVRCEIKNSSVNKAIKNSIRTRRGREDFKHLNNGITIICDGFKYVGGRENPTAIEILRPGIINGLQTVKALADSAKKVLEGNDSDHFHEHCHILARVHNQNSVADYRELVKSTNNQNPMKSRNLRSNDPEQVIFEKYFADMLGWFYERKEGAWNAFNADHARWSTINKKPKHFKNGRNTKKVDNEKLAQAWLAFIGFSEQAVDQKRLLFSSDEKLYGLIFLSRTPHHGRDYEHRIANQKLDEDMTTESPAPEGMLAAYLVREFAEQVVRSRKENREEAVSRLKINGLDRSEQDSKLEKDPEYLKGLVLRSMLLLFVEFLGYAMFLAFKENVHETLPKLLENDSLKEIVNSGSLSEVKARVYDDDYDSSNDVLIQLWKLYDHCVEQMIVEGAWIRARQQAANVSKFMYSEKTRNPLYDAFRHANAVFKKGSLMRVWTIPFNEAGSVEQYLRLKLR